MRAYLTIDDAPSAGLSEKLEVLEEVDGSAPFFCEGRRLAEHPERARRAVESGFHLGNHTYSHTRASELSVEAFEREVVRTEALLEDVYDRAGVPRPARAFRFPYGDEGGDRADRFQRVLETEGVVPPCSDQVNGGIPADGYGWPWTFSVEDWTVDAESELRERVDSAVERAEQRDGEIVLFHDAGNSTALFEAFVTRLRDNGVELLDPLRLVR